MLRKPFKERYSKLSLADAAGSRNGANFFSNRSCALVFALPTFFTSRLGVTSASLPALGPTCSWDNFLPDKGVQAGGGVDLAVGNVAVDLGRSTVTLVEDGLMVAMAAGALLGGSVSI